MTQMRNDEVVNRFVESDFGHDGYGSVRSTESGELYSYRAKIAEWVDGEIVVHDGWDGYSPTTSKHFKFLHDALDKSGVPWEATHEPSGKGKHKPRWHSEA